MKQQRKFVLDNLLTLIKGDDGRLRNIYIDNLPNVKNFKIITQGENIPMATLNISKKVKSHLEIETYKNKRINRYIEHQVLRLKKHRLTPIKYWEIAFKLLKRSVSWKLIHLNRVYPKWYRAPLWWILKNIKELEKHATDFAGNIDFKRVYIPKTTGSLKEWALKGNKQWRPLGVPTLSWRIYLSMLNTILVIYLEPTWPKNQHGYFPRKGTLTVWREILRRISSPDIYEFDLKQFFPSVEIQAISKILRNLETPKWVVEYIENLNKSKPKLAIEDLVDERKTREAQDLAAGKVSRDQQWYEPVKEFIEMNGIELWHQLLIEDTGGVTVYHEWEFVQLQAALFASFKDDQQFHGTFQGLPQGGGISPTLSVQVLNKFIEENDAVMYADDGLFFKEPNREAFSKYASTGIKQNEEKSGWVKKAGKWLKELKFCGLIYDGRENGGRLYSQTRKGKTLEISKKGFQQLKNAWELWGSDGSPIRNNTWYELMMSRISGFVQACLYAGTFSLQDYWDRWEITAHQQSWQKSKMAKRMFKKDGIKPNLYNSSSVACKWFMNHCRRPYRGR